MAHSCEGLEIYLQGLFCDWKERLQRTQADNRANPSQQAIGFNRDGWRATQKRDEEA